MTPQQAYQKIPEVRDLVDQVVRLRQMQQEILARVSSREHVPSVLLEKTREQERLVEQTAARFLSTCPLEGSPGAAPGSAAWLPDISPGPWAAELMKCGVMVGVRSLVTDKPVFMLGASKVLRFPDVAAVERLPDLVEFAGHYSRGRELLRSIVVAVEHAKGGR